MSELLHYFLVGLIPMLVVFGMVVVIMFWAWLANKIANGNYILALIIILTPLIIFCYNCFWLSNSTLHLT